MSDKGSIHLGLLEGQPVQLDGWPILRNSEEMRMMNPESEGSFSTSDGWLMDILMKLGSAQTILSALCCSIEKANPGITVALVCPDRQSGKLTYIVAPSLSDSFSPSQLRLEYIMDGLDSVNAVGAIGSKNQLPSGEWESDARGSNIWWSGIYKLGAEHDVSLLAVWQSHESLPPELDIDSIRSAMCLVIRIFGRESVPTQFPYSPELVPSVAHVN